MRQRLTLAALLLLATGPVGAEGFRVVANPSVSASTMSAAELSRLFLKTTTSWPDGQKAVVVDQERTSPVRAAFSRGVHQRDPEAVVAYWQTMVFSGRETPPPVRNGDAAVLTLVRTTPGAVGYVSDTAALEGVKTIAVK